MYVVDYYTRPNGDKPVKTWLEQLEKSNKKLSNLMRAKLLKLEEEPLDKLIRTKMVRSIKGVRRDNLYEVVANQARVCVYHEIMEGKFVALHGFLKKKQTETHEIERCCYWLDEYIANKGRF